MRVRDAMRSKKLGQDMTTHPEELSHPEELLRGKFFPYEYFQKRKADIPGNDFAMKYKQKCNADEDDPLQYVKMRRAAKGNNLNNDGTDLITY